MKNNLTEFWNKAVSFEKYLQDIENAILHPQDENYTQYYELNKKRIERLLKTYSADENQKNAFLQKQFVGKILIISEGWCGDAAQSVPVIYNFFKETNEVKIIYRDTHPELIEMFLTNGAKSIPIVIFLDEENNVLFHWGPRPEYGNVLLKKHKENPENYPKEEFQKDLQTAYNKDKGFAIIEEILKKL